MKIFYTADLHGQERLFNQLFELSLKEKVGAILLGGDMLPKEGDFSNSFDLQKKFIHRFLQPYLEEIHRQIADLKIYTMMGNDDWSGNLPYIEELESQGLLSLLHQKKFILQGGFEVIGYGIVPPTPFSVKDWERIDLPGAPIEPQIYSAYISSGKGMKRINPYEYFQAQKNMEEEIADLPIPSSFQKTVYVFHAPPFQTRLDQLFDGRPIGSRAIRQFIERYQPLLTFHGHIHESPYRSGYYLDRIGETLCINPGQSGKKLHAVTLNLDQIEETIKHTVLS